MNRHLPFALVLAACGGSAPATPPPTAVPIPRAPEPPKAAELPALDEPSLKTAPADSIFEWHLIDTGVGATLRAIAHEGMTIAVGDEGTILHRTSNIHQWTRDDSPTREQLHGVTCSPSRRLNFACWAVGTHGTILRTDPWSKKWEPEPSGTVEDLESVGYARDDETPFVYAVGAGGTILRRDLDKPVWKAMASNVTAHLRALSSVEYGAKPMSTTYVVGDGGTALRLEGDRWRRLTTGTTASLRSSTITWPDVDAPIPYRVHVTGENGVVVHAPTATGEPWTLDRAPTRAWLGALVKTTFLPAAQGRDGKIEDHVVACGERGTILIQRDAGDAWTRLTGLPTNADLHAMVDDRSELVFVGSGGTILYALLDAHARDRWKDNR